MSADRRADPAYGTAVNIMPESVAAALPIYSVETESRLSRLELTARG